MRTKQKILLIFSDGNDTASTLVPDPPAVVTALRTCGVRPFAIGMGDVQIADLAAIVGNDLAAPHNAAELDAAFAHIRTELNALYTLRVVTVVPETILQSSTLTVNYKGRTISGTFAPPAASCVAPPGFTGLPPSSQFP